MMIGERLRALREQKNLSQCDIETKSGLLRCYISRVENGHTVPTVETLHRIARALGIPVYQLVHDGASPVVPISFSSMLRKEKMWGDAEFEARQLRRLMRNLSKMKPRELHLLMAMARQAAMRAT